MSEWLSSRRRKAAQRSDEVAARDAALLNKAALEEALAYEVAVQDGEPPEIVPELICLCMKAPQQNTPHAWLSQGFCRIQEKTGVSTAAALKLYNS